jgi:acetyltransferase-like isoleucine patch superfamily enzyme
MNIFNRIFIKIKNTISAYHYKSKFKKFGNNSYIIQPLVIRGHENIIIEDNVLIAHQVWLNAITLKENTCLLKIGAGCNIGHYNHISASGEVILEEEVLTADKVYISDHLHAYEDISVSILKQPVLQKNFVRIGKGSWIGENVCIIGSSIGKHCVIGANAVVTKNIGDYCVAVGNPAKIIKRYCLETGVWMKTLPDGTFAASQLAP